MWVIGLLAFVFVLEALYRRRMEDDLRDEIKGLWHEVESLDKQLCKHMTEDHE